MTRISFSREPLRTTEVLGSFGQACSGGSPSFKSSGVMTCADAFAFGDNKKIAFLRPVAAAGLIFLRRSEPPRRSETLRWRASSKEASVAFASDTAFVFSSSAMSLDLSRV